MSSFIQTCTNLCTPCDGFDIEAVTTSRGQNVEKALKQTKSCFTLRNVDCIKAIYYHPKFNQEILAHIYVKSLFQTTKVSAHLLVNQIYFHFTNSHK